MDNKPLEIDFEKLVAEFTVQSEAQQQAVRDLDKASEQLATSTNTEVDAIQREGVLTGQIQTALDGILIERSRKNKETAAFFGVNPEAHNSIIQAMSQDLVARNAELKVAGDQIAAKKAVSAGDNPFEWLINQFTVPFEENAYASKKAVFDQQAEALAKLGNLADQQIARNNAIDANTNAALSDLVAQRALAQAQVKAEDARQKALASGVQFGSVRLAATQQQFGNMVQLHNAAIAVQQLQLSRSTKELNEAMKKLQEKNLQLLIEAREDDLKARATLQVQLDKATSILGMRKVTAQEFKNMPMISQKALYDVMANPNIEQGRLGYDTVDAMETVNNLNAPLTPALTQVRKVLNSWSSEFAGNNPAANAMKPADRHSAQQKAIDQKIKSEANNIPDAGGLYSAPSLSSIAGIPAVANTILWKSSFAPQAAAQKNAPTSAQAMYDAALSLVVDKKMDIDRAAAEVSQIYKAVTMDNNTNRDYNRFALPMQNNYRTHIRTGADGAFNAGGRIVDMTSEMDVKNNMLRALSAMRGKSPIGGFN